MAYRLGIGAQVTALPPLIARLATAIWRKGARKRSGIYSLNIAGCCKIRSGKQVETCYSMTTNDNSGPKRAANSPVFLVGSRPSFLDVLSSHPSLLERRTEEKEEDRPETKGAPPEADPLSQHTVRLQRFAKWSMAATLVSILCMAWVAWSIYELHDFALRQAKSVSDSIEISRLAILAANRRAEATEKTIDLATETSRSQLRAYVSVVGISTQNAFEKNMASSLNYKNAGQTPAVGVRTVTDAMIISSSGPDVKLPRTYSTSYGGDNEPTSPLGGGIAASDPINKTFKEAELEEFRAGNKTYVVWGVIYYSDVFGRNHYTRFCRYFRNGEASHWNLCQTGNDSN
jgi:hypothetical protein